MCEVLCMGVIYVGGVDLVFVDCYVDYLIVKIFELVIIFNKKIDVYLYVCDILGFYEFNKFVDYIE